MTPLESLVTSVERQAIVELYRTTLATHEALAKAFGVKPSVVNRVIHADIPQGERLALVRLRRVNAAKRKPCPHCGR